MTPEPLQNLQQLEDLRFQLAEAKGALDWQTERANTAVNRFQEARAERDALQARVDGALDVLYETYRRGGHATKEAIKILTGEGES